MAVKPLTMTVTQERVLTDNQTVPREVDCRHHWIIAPPNGPTSLGTCIFCGTWGDFPNSIDQTVSSEVSEHLAVRLRGTTIWDKIISSSQSNCQMFRNL